VTEAVMEKMAKWEKLMGKTLHWTHFSDRSSFDYRDSISKRSQQFEVSIVSKQRIRLQAVDKFAGSVRLRMDIMRKLLFQDRIFMSRANCPHLAASVAALRPGKNGSPIEKGSEHRHVFDSTTYPLQALCAEELFRANKAQFTPEDGGSRLIIVEL
jgi:hypothetical protein